MEEPVQDPGPPCRRGVQPGSARFPVRHEVGRVVPAGGGAASEVSAWGLRELRERQGGGGGGAGGGVECCGVAGCRGVGLLDCYAIAKSK